MEAILREYVRSILLQERDESDIVLTMKDKGELLARVLEKPSRRFYKDDVVCGKRLNTTFDHNSRFANMGITPFDVITAVKKGKAEAENGIKIALGDPELRNVIVQAMGDSILKQLKDMRDVKFNAVVNVDSSSSFAGELAAYVANVLGVEQVGPDASGIRKLTRHDVSSYDDLIDWPKLKAEDERREQTGQKPLTDIVVKNAKSVFHNQMARGEKLSIARHFKQSVRPYIKLFKLEDGAENLYNKALIVDDNLDTGASLHMIKKLLADKGMKSTLAAGYVLPTSKSVTAVERERERAKNRFNQQTEE